MACAGCHRVVVYPLWPPHNGLRCRLLHLSGVWRLITVWCSQWAGLHLQDVVATISSEPAARISSSVPRQVHALVFRTDKVLHGRPLELGLLPVGRRYWHHHAWTHWDLNPGPSACEADVIPLHHVPSDEYLKQEASSNFIQFKSRFGLRDLFRTQVPKLPTLPNCIIV